MNAFSILDKLASYVDQHIKGTRGLVHQEPYLGDIFRLFAEAFQSASDSEPSAGILTGDGIVEGVLERLPLSSGDKRVRDIAKKIGEMWDTWTYAWVRYPDFH